jgi:hypothetical protein
MTKSVDTSQKVLNAWALSLIVWSVYRATFKTDLPLWIDEFFAKPFVFLFPAFWYISRTEKKSFITAFGLSSKNVWKELGIGLAVGSIFFILALLVHFVNGSDYAFTFNANTVIWVFGMIAAGFSEQLLSTGFVFKRLYEEGRGVIKPVLTSAVLFSFLHVPALFGVDKIAGNILMQSLILNFVISITTSTLYVLRKCTIAPIVVHALYFLSLPFMM